MTATAHQTLTVRDMTAADLAPVQALMKQLGYDIDAAELEHRFAAVTAGGDGHVQLVAELDGRIVGLLHVFARPALEKPTEALVQSLVVDETCRGAGIGRALMTSAETWAKDRGLGSVALHTQAKRMDARAFYKSLGYDEITQSMMLRKTLDAQ